MGRRGYGFGVARRRARGGGAAIGAIMDPRSGFEWLNITDPRPSHLGIVVTDPRMLEDG